MTSPYRNPVWDGYLADPFVLRLPDRPDSTPGGWVAIGTGGVVDGRVFQVLESDDLVTWRPVGGALVPLDEAAGTDYWAPEVTGAQGRWWMYYSVGHGDAGHHLRVAVADDPRGPYEDCGVDLTPDERFAIDPHPFVDDDGATYLYYAHDVLDGARAGTMLAVDVLETPTRLRGAPVEVLSATADWQVYERDRAMYGATYDWHTLEGPTVARRDGRYHLLYSGGSWLGETYAVGHAVADHPLGPWSEPHPGAAVLRTVPGKVVGPGHLSLTTSAAGRDVLVYHAWDPGLVARRMCLDPVVLTADAALTDGPTWEPTTLERDLV